MKTKLAFILLAMIAPAASAAETLFDGKTPRAFAFEVAGDEAGRKLPYFRSFPAGKDKDDTDVDGTLGTLKFARGASKLYPEEDAKPGLIVLLRRMVLVPQKSGDYEAILEGEFNAVKTPIAKEVLEKLQKGGVTELKFDSDTTKGIRPVAYRVHACTTLRAAIRDGNLVVYGGEGCVTITHYALTGTFPYESKPIAFGPETNVKPIYIGRAVEPVVKSDGKVETLPIIN